jgi:UDP-N-acetylmuramoylalanine--D-glutamate ligase
MINTEYFKGKNVVVVGLARSGFSCALLLQRLGAHVKVTDNASNEDVQEKAERLRARNILIELGGHSESFLSKTDVVVISPGVGLTSLPVQWARGKGIPLMSEVEIAWLLCPASVIAVTGSNGKTTTTTLIGQVLRAHGKKTFICGNIGTPFSQEVADMREGDYVVLEISSFQLEAIRTFQPKIAVVLNCTPNHLDRYASMEEYAAAKKRIFKNQNAGDYLLLNKKDPEVSSWEKEARSKVVFFSGDEKINEDQAAVRAVAAILGVPGEIVDAVVADFKGIEHRMELVAQTNGVSFVNDSKATTVDSARWALENIKTPVIWIAGGKHKGVDYTVIAELVRKKVKELIVIGEARELIRAALESVVKVSEASSLEDAVRLGFAKASAGDTVLLSPMCSSYDMFKDYEERGRSFKKIAEEVVDAAARDKIFKSRTKPGDRQ